MTAPDTTILIRRARLDDSGSLRRLAQLDSARVPGGDLFVAEVDGRLRAALTVDGRTAIADPFFPSADALALLRTRARALDSRDGRRAVPLAGRRAARALRPRHAG
jgi:hypothetical protein